MSRNQHQTQVQVQALFQCPRRHRPPNRRSSRLLWEARTPHCPVHLTSHASSPVSRFEILVFFLTLFQATWLDCILKSFLTTAVGVEVHVVTLHWELEAKLLRLSAGTKGKGRLWLLNESTSWQFHHIVPGLLLLPLLERSYDIPMYFHQALYHRGGLRRTNT